MTRSTWGSRIGFILAAAGSAIGLGAIWKFPYVTANNGGGIFLLFYLFFCLTLGLILMVTEWSLGRAAAAGPVGVFKKFAPNSPSLRIIGYTFILICLLILSFYCAVGGWTLAYLWKSINGTLLTSDTTRLSQQFTAFVSHPFHPLIAFAAFTLLTLAVVIGGVRRGIELLSKYLMPALFILMLVLIVRGLTLPGATRGLIYFLQPDPSKITGRMLIDALGLAFFSLSLGIGIMVTYGSYIPAKTRLIPSALWVISLTITTCLLAGLMVLPPVFAFNFDPNSGPSLTMVTMPAVFAHMPLGSLFAILFFTLLFFAALTSSVSILEVVTAFLIDEFQLSRRTSAILSTSIFTLLGIAVTWSLGKGPLHHLTLFQKNIFDLFDYATSNLLMPLCEIAISLFAGWKLLPLLEQQLSNNNSTSTPAPAANSPRPWYFPIIKYSLRYAAPALIALILISSL